MSATMRDIGSFIKTVMSVKPQNQTGSANVSGTAVDRTGQYSMRLHAMCGAASGSPTAQSHTVKIQESSDNSTFTDVSGASVTLDADDESLTLDIDLSGYKQYVRAVLVTSFTGGSTPANDFAATLTLGGDDERPAS